MRYIVSMRCCAGGLERHTGEISATTFEYSHHLRMFYRLMGRGLGMIYMLAAAQDNEDIANHCIPPGPHSVSWDSASY